MDRPRPKEDIDWEEVKRLAEDHLDEVENDEAEDSDTPHYIFEAVMIAVYGRNVFDWENQLDEDRDEEE